jgi:hypothetical protein
LQAARHFGKELVAGQMAERVVDRLEAVEVDHHHGDAAAIAFQPPARFLEAGVEFGAVGKPGQDVVPRQMHDLGLGAAAFGDVLDHGDPAAAFHRLARQHDEFAVMQLIDP